VSGEWRQRWPALVALAVLVAFAGGVATALWAGARRADTAYERFQLATGAANLTAQLRLTAGLSALDPEVFTGAGRAVTDVAAVPGVERASSDAWWAATPESEIVNEAPVAFLTGIYTSIGTPNPFDVIAGTLPGPDEPDSAIVNAEALRRTGWQLGSVVRLRTVSPNRFAEWVGNDGSLESVDSFDGPTIDVVVRAVFRSEEDFLEDRDPVLAVTEAFAREYNDDIAHAVPTISIRADPGRVDEVAEQLRPILNEYEMDLFPAERTDTSVRPTISVEVTTLRIAALTAAVVGLLVIVQAAARQMSAIGEQHHIRAALGMTPTARVMGSWLAVVPAIGLGTLMVPVVGWAFSGLFPRGVARDAEPQLGLRVDTFALTFGAAATCVLGAVAVLAVAVLVARPPRPVRPRRSVLSGAFLSRPAMSLGASFATDPSGRHRRVPLVAGTALLGIACGVGALVVVATIESSREHLEATPRLYGSPTGFVMETNGRSGIPEAIAAALETDGVDALTERMVINDDELEATGPGGSRQVAPMAYQVHKGGALPTVVTGRYPQGPDEVALGRGTARDLGAQVGDEVHIAAFDGSADLDLAVTGLVMPGGTQDQSKAFVVSTDTLATLLCGSDPLEECDLSIDLFANAPAAQAGAALEQIGFEPAPVPPSVERIGQTGSLPWYLAGFLCLLGAAGLLHELVTTVRRRRHDLAVTRALGLTPRRAASAITWQSVLTALAGALLGLLLGAIGGSVVWSRIAKSLGVLESSVLPTWWVALVVVAVLGAAAVVSVPPRWRAGRIPLAPVLRSE
jgi:ABC-type lipoprotein release transport system permease subunit